MFQITLVAEIIATVDATSENTFKLPNLRN